MEFQVRVEDSPNRIFSGLALMVTDGTGMLTDTLTLFVVVPPGPPAVSVKVVVSVGETSKVPFGSTLPMPGSMLMVSASITFQDRALDSPSVMVCGAAEKVTLGG